MTTRITLNSALLIAIGLAVLVAIVPAGVALDARLSRSLIERARDDIALAPRLLADRNAAWSDALMMRAKDLAHAPGLATAVARGDRAGVLAAIEAVRPSLGAVAPLVAATDARMNVGFAPDSNLLAETRLGRMPVTLAMDGAMMHTVALAPLELDGRWVGAAGVATPLGNEEVIGFKGLSRSDVIVASMGDVVSATTLDTALARAILSAARGTSPGEAPREVSLAGARYLVVKAPLANAGTATFVRSVAEELAVLPGLRRTAALAAVGAVVLAFLLGAWMARRISRPVQQLASVARAIGEGHFDDVLPDSRITEVATVSARVDEMRRALRARLVELRESNDALQDRSVRLAALQSDLLQRERLAVAGRLVAQLAHEIRNPIASLRNCLEVVRRRMTRDPEGAEFADLAINELLRMHELTEQMLDVSRPRTSGVARCAPVQVARDVVRLVTAGILERDLRIDVTGDASIRAAIAGDALKQVLLNAVQNAREARGEATDGVQVHIDIARRDTGLTITIDDNGPGFAPSLRDRVFDPFFSTKADLHGVGLGLFVAEGLVRGAGGRLVATDAPGGGARLLLELQAALPDEEAAAPLSPSVTR